MIASLRIVWTHPPSRAVALVFSLVSIVVGSWFARIPEVQSTLGLTEATLGIVLLGMPLGTLLVMPLSGWLVAQWGAGHVTLSAALGQAVPFLFLPAVESGIGLALVLLGAGVMNGTLNVAMNARANAVEEARDTAIMSTCHAFFSLGGMVGAGVGSAAAALALPLGSQFAGLVVLGAVVVLLHRHVLVGGPTKRQTGAVFAVPSPTLAGLAALLFCIMLTEGAVSNWSAVYLRTGLGASPGVAGLGYTAFAAAMALGRLYGDRLIEQLATRRLVQGGALLASVGLGTAVLIGHPVSGIAGFFVQGLGFAVLVPLLYRTAARTPGMAPGSSIAAIATGGYLGLLTGPPLLGFVADTMGVSTAIGGVAALAGMVAAMAGPILRRSEAA